MPMGGQAGVARDRGGQQLTLVQEFSFLRMCTGDAVCLIIIACGSSVRVALYPRRSGSAGAEALVWDHYNRLVRSGTPGTRLAFHLSRRVIYQRGSVRLGSVGIASGVLRTQIRFLISRQSHQRVRAPLSPCFTMHDWRTENGEANTIVCIHCIRELRYARRERNITACSSWLGATRAEKDGFTRLFNLSRDSQLRERERELINIYKFCILPIRSSISRPRPTTYHYPFNSMIYARAK